MDYQIPLLFCSSCLCLYFLKHRSPAKHQLPPGRIGNIFQLTNSPHHSLANLSTIYGPLMSLQLGSLTTVVVSSIDMEKDVFLNLVLSFSSRIILDAAQEMIHYKYSIALLLVSPKWRSLRKICAVHLFTKKSLDATELLRQEKVQELIEYVGERCRNGQTVEIGGAIFATLLNLLSNTFISIDLATNSSTVSQEFKGVVWALMEPNAKPNLVDFFPVLGCFDLIGIRRNEEAYIRKFFAIFDDIIEKKLSLDQPFTPFLFILSYVK